VTLYDLGVQPLSAPQLERPYATARVPQFVRSAPPPLRGGPLTFLRFARDHHMFTPGYFLLMARWLWLKLRWRGRLQTDGMCFVCPGVKFEIGRQATVSLGRWSWIGHQSKIRSHEGEV